MGMCSAVAVLDTEENVGTIKQWLGRGEIENEMDRFFAGQRRLARGLGNGRHLRFIDAYACWSHPCRWLNF